MTKDKVTVKAEPVIAALETYFNRFATFTDAYSLPIALWTICTYIFPYLDCFPYMVITSETKRSGKTRLAELISFACSNPRNFGAMTPSSMFRIIEEVSPTVFFDEAEILSQESAGVMRSVLNMGYRKGSKVPRTVGQKVVEFNTYCPKVFILIGDVLDTLRDRSVVVRMKRAEARERFVYESVKADGESLREQISEMLDGTANAAGRLQEILSAYADFKGIEFLTDRDEEIWSPIFVLASVICPERIEELSRIAVDMATEKTREKVKYTQLVKDGAETEAQNEEYRLRLLNDLHSVIRTGEKNITSVEAVERLKAINTAPWRKFRGTGLTYNNISDMLKPLHLKSGPIRQGSKVAKGFKTVDIQAAMKKYAPVTIAGEQKATLGHDRKTGEMD